MEIEKGMIGGDKSRWQYRKRWVGIEAGGS